MRTYNLDDYNGILSTIPKVNLNEDVIRIYDDLLKKLNINTQPTNENEYRKINRKSRYPKKPELLTSDKVVEFKERTVIEKSGPEKIMINVRGCFNKLSSKCYGTQRDLLLSYLDELTELNDESHLIECSNHFFDVASKNKFYSEMYAKLYKELIQLYPIFEERKEQFLQECSDNMNNIEYVDETSDYEAFCKNNKKNDIRRSMNTFLINLHKTDECSMVNILKMINTIQEKISENKNIAENSPIIEELTENLYLFISQLTNELKNHKTWENIFGFVSEFSKYKAKDYPGLTSRIIFKYMDMIDECKK